MYPGHRSCRGSKLRSAVAIARRVGREANRKQVEKHFEITITESDLTFARRRDRIEAEARLDGLYTVRTNLNAQDLFVEDAVWAYSAWAQLPEHGRRIPLIFRTS